MNGFHNRMITVLGSNGFIGSHVVKRLDVLGIPYYAPKRNNDLQDKALGNIVYCIGLTADFRQRPLETVEAHVCKVLDVLRNARFESLLYLSSTRIYNFDHAEGMEEGTLTMDPANPGDLYNISKIMGESLLHASGHAFQIARLSNVYGMDFKSDNFLSNVIRRAIDKKHVVLETTLESEKDYISVDDAINTLLQIALKGKQAVYNVASGVNVSNLEIMDHLFKLTNCRVEVRPDAKTIKFPKINVDRTRSEFGCQPSDLMGDLASLVYLYKTQHGENQQ